jgi:hypothetical protein
MNRCDFITPVLVGCCLFIAGTSFAFAVESPTAEQVEIWIANPETLSANLRAVTTLNVDAAKVLAKHKVMRLTLDGLTSIGPEVARILSYPTSPGNRNGAYLLSLNGLKTITPEVADGRAVS